MTLKMNKFILTILLTIFSTSAMAEWTQIASSDEYFLFADKASISKSGNVAKMRTLNEYVSIQEKIHGTYFSVKLYSEYDCVRKMKNILQLTAYSESMAKGNVVMSTQTSKKDWTYIKPNSMYETAYQVACGKK
jgi:hypothetical protein